MGHAEAVPGRRWARAALAGATGIGSVFVVFWYAAILSTLWRLQLNDLGKFYHGTRAWLDGGSLYAANAATLMDLGGGVEKHLYNLNPPHFHLLLVPIASLPPSGVFAIWLLTSIVGVLLSLRIAASEVRYPRHEALGLAVLALLLSHPLWFWAVTGQMTFQILPVVVVAWSCARRGDWARTGAWLGVAVSVKPFFALLVVWAALRGGWRAPVTAALVSLVIYAVGFAVFGAEVYREWHATIARIDWYQMPGNASLLGLLTRTLQDSHEYASMIHRPELIRPLFLTGFAAIGGVALVAAWWDRTERSVDRGFAQVLTAALLMSPLGWTYYTPWLLLPILGAYAGSGSLSATRVRSPGAIEAGLLFVAAALLIAPPYIELVVPGEWRHPALTVTGGSAFFWAHVAIWVALLAGARGTDGARANRV